ncbi:iron-containing redox enzyme family protein [Marinactinospora thermotolerans]|uniref:Iron-containing redox enzyme n=1 Tax=Marinactinospora thermotolerans DSM 45154 TaxID=1122192 RepID=A0A1T4T4G8_9ACTN|nr:iron-containing redox enzyme family protein [Marinactinospora thermotolerans]SKA35326.1 Iron-containing redox enzyme [Marinactinospora thermotolerans DSM 45154]
MPLPTPRGPLTEALFAELTGPVGELAPLPAPARGPADTALHDEDLQLALHVCYELHYNGYDEVAADWEWEPSLLRVRRGLERRFEQALRAVVPPLPRVDAAEVPRALARMTARETGPSLSAFLQRRADIEQFREFVVHRSVYHLKEADPHTWAIPRLRGAAKAALVEIQADEYGGGRPERMHAELFRATMRGLGLDDSYGAHVERAPAITLAVDNAMSLLGLHRSRRAALLGHLAAFEMTSSLPNRAYSAGLRRLGADAATRLFYDEHVQADAVHEQVAAHDMCGRFAGEHPDLAGEVLFGAGVCLELDRLFATHLMACWERGASSLRAEDPIGRGVPA